MIHSIADRLPSLPEVGAVLLTSDGDPLEAPLPSGELSSEPLEARDLQSLVVAPPRRDFAVP
jgi:hypothetical protein